MNNRSYRTYSKWLISHLRTGYGYLFKNIPENYLKYNNKWLDRVTDQAEMFCVAEMACNNIYHINEILCIYNKSNSIIYSNSWYNDKTSKIRIEIENYVKNCVPLNKLNKFNYIQCDVQKYIPSMFIINLEIHKHNINRINKMFLNKKFDYHFFKGCNGYEEKFVKKKYEEYLLKCENLKRRKIMTLGSIGLIYSTILLFEYINNNFDIDHVIIFEDDIYIHKNFDNLYHFDKKQLEGKDLIYLGFNIYSDELNKKIINKNNKIKMIEIAKDVKEYIYGTYSYVCSRKFRNYVIDIGADNMILNNYPIDGFYNILRNIDGKNLFPNELTFYILSNNLFIPEVRKNGINVYRDETFYTKRLMDLNDYVIENIYVK